MTENLSPDIRGGGAVAGGQPALAGGSGNGAGSGTPFGRLDGGCAPAPYKFFFTIELFFVNLHNKVMKFLALLLQLESFLVEA